MMMDEIVYYLSQFDDEPLIRLYESSHLKKSVVVQYHDDNGHSGGEKNISRNQTKVCLVWLVKRDKRVRK